MKKKETTGSLMLFVTAMIWGSAFLAQQSGMEHIGPFTMQAAAICNWMIPSGPTFVQKTSAARSASAVTMQTNLPEPMPGC